MNPVSISPSLLEEYRKTRLGLFDKTGDELEAYILGAVQRTPAMARGEAYHLLLEKGGEPYRQPLGELSVFQVAVSDGTFTFSEAAAKPVLETRAAFPDLLHEVWGGLEMDVSGRTVKMRLRLDGLEPERLTAHEFKTTGSQPSYMDYFDSMQWRCYLAAFTELEGVEYRIFQLGTGNDWCRLHQYRFERQTENEEMVRTELEGLLGWLETRPAVLAFLEAKAEKIG